MKDRFKMRAPQRDGIVAAPFRAGAKGRTAETTLWDLIDPELAGLAMASLYGSEAPCRMRQMADACAEAGRASDSAFWRAALQTAGQDEAEGEAAILQTPSLRPLPN